MNHLGTRPLGDDDMARIARKTISDVARLSAMPGDRLGEAEKARQRFQDAIYNVVIALEHGSPPERWQRGWRRRSSSIPP
jgi:hypothetical protein